MNRGHAAGGKNGPLCTASPTQQNCPHGHSEQPARSANASSRAGDRHFGLVVIQEAPQPRFPKGPFCSSSPQLNLLLLTAVLFCLAGSWALPFQSQSRKYGTRVPWHLHAGLQEDDPKDVTNDNYATPNSPFKVRYDKARRVFNAFSGAEEERGAETSLLGVINQTCFDCVTESARKFREGDAYYSNPKVQMGTWLDGGHLARVVHVMNSTMMDPKSQQVFRRDTMQLLKISLTPGEGRQFTLTFFHVPAYAELPGRTHKEGTVTIYKALYGTGRLDSFIKERKMQSDCLQGPSTPHPTGSLLSRIGGPRRVFRWERPGSASTLQTDEPGTGGPTGFLELSFYPPDAADDEELVHDEGPVRELFPAAVDLDALLTTTLALEAAARNLSATAAAVNEGAGRRAGRRYNQVYGELQRRIGGLDRALGDVVRRVLKSRSLKPAILTSLGLSHVRGLLLHGPPGTGKTLMAREIAHALRARATKVVNGPELLDKFVGEAERNVRLLFAEADEEWERSGHQSELHVIILDELDSIGRRRGAGGAAGGEGSGVRESVLNQLLCKMDGVMERNNFLVIGMTNRLDLIDEALLRPGRLEVHIKVDAPDKQGREMILWIMMRPLVRSAYMTLGEAGAFADRLSRITAGYTGADLAGVMRSASSFALTRWEEARERQPGPEENEQDEAGENEQDKGGDIRSLTFLWEDFAGAMKEVGRRPSFAAALRERLRGPPLWRTRTEASSGAGSRTIEDVILGDLDGRL